MIARLTALLLLACSCTPDEAPEYLQNRTRTQGIKFDTSADDCIRRATRIYVDTHETDGPQAYEIRCQFVVESYLRLYTGHVNAGRPQQIMVPASHAMVRNRYVRCWLETGGVFFWTSLNPDGIGWPD
jgi:hypothetical protein